MQRSSKRARKNRLPFLIFALLVVACSKVDWWILRRSLLNALRWQYSTMDWKSLGLKPMPVDRFKWVACVVACIKLKAHQALPLVASGNKAWPLPRREIVL
jgi:hypothetical protein